MNQIVKIKALRVLRVWEQEITMTRYIFKQIRPIYELYPNWETTVIGTVRYQDTFGPSDGWILLTVKDKGSTAEPVLVRLNKSTFINCGYDKALNTPLESIPHIILPN